VVLVLAIHQRLKSYAPRFSKLTSAFGIIWVGLVIASGMIANIGPNSVIGIRATENAMLVWSSVSLISEGLGGGNKIIGKILVLLISSIALKGQLFSKPLVYLEIVGISGVLTIYPLEIFEMRQIIWFL
jgi:hypothetical protein